MRSIPDDGLAGTIRGMGLADGSGFTPDDLVDAVRSRKAVEQGEGPAGAAPSLTEQEYDALIRVKPELSRTQEFVCEPAQGVDDEVRKWFDAVMLVKRLREVRALESFTRLTPFSPGDPSDRRAPLTKDPPEWLPAVEVQGEGVFLRLEEERLKRWEQREDVTKRAARIIAAYVSRAAVSGTTAAGVVSARLLLIHTLAHVLINEWSFESGYPSASLRERLYVSSEMRGLLIYTATSDSAGSLGGVVAQADKGRLKTVLHQAVARAAWCSADPLCIEADAAGVDSLNLAACHACALLPESSCENGNVLLDRGLLVGTPGDPSLGFFADLLTEI